MAVILDLVLACLLGGMMFFPIVVAPTVFKVLDGAQASAFLRRMFVGYYRYVMIGSALAAGLLYQDWLAALAMAAVAASTAYVLFVYMPKLNAWSDAELAGDEAAKAKFAAGHRATVILNAVQMLIIIGIVIGRGLGLLA
ncbi:MAG: DUF4149 domain-containing protein [Pseudomonadota bacterium]